MASAYSPRRLKSSYPKMLRSNAPCQRRAMPWNIKFLGTSPSPSHLFLIAGRRIVQVSSPTAASVATATATATATVLVVVAAAAVDSAVAPRIIKISSSAHTLLHNQTTQLPYKTQPPKRLEINPCTSSAATHSAAPPLFPPPSALHVPPTLASPVLLALYSASRNSLPSVGHSCRTTA
jgi:hypothetical protein